MVLCASLSACFCRPGVEIFQPQSAPGRASLMNDKVSSRTEQMNDYQPVKVSVLAQNPMLTLQQWNNSLKENRAPLICKPVPSKPTAEALGNTVHYTTAEETTSKAVRAQREVERTGCFPDAGRGI